MMLSRVERIEQIEQLKSIFHVKPLTNCFLMKPELMELVENKELYHWGGDNSFVLLADRGHFYQFYYYVDRECPRLPAFSFGKTAVTEVIFHGDEETILRQTSFLKDAGFKPYIGRSRMTMELREGNTDVQGVVFAELTHCDIIKQMFDDAFEPYTSELPQKDELDSIIRDKHVICVLSEDGNQVLGALHYTHQNAVSVLSHLVVDTDARGQGIASRLLNRWRKLSFETGKKRLLLWVRDDNPVAVRLYQKFGFAFDGRKTLSFIKYE